MPNFNTTRRLSDVRGTYAILMVTRNRKPWMVGKLADDLQHSLTRHLTEQFDGIRLDELRIHPDHLHMVITIKGDVKKSAKGFAYTARMGAAAELMERHGEELKAAGVSLNLGLFARDMLVRTIGDGITDDEESTFLEAHEPSRK